MLALTEDSFAVVRLAGERITLDEFAVFRSDNEDRYEHDLTFGDLNSDGYMDMVVLDANEQMCQVFTFSASGKMYFANEFKVFETRLFQQGAGRTFEPSAAIIADLTGDDHSDLVLQVHDRYLIYPQARPQSEALSETLRVAWARNAWLCKSPFAHDSRLGGATWVPWSERSGGHDERA
ncbi:MAG: FG-GAP repeat domain-containing protein [Phycisphaerales bacterium]